MTQRKCENCIHEDLCSALNGRQENGDATDCIYYLESNQTKAKTYVRTCVTCGYVGPTEDFENISGEDVCYTCSLGYNPVCPRGYMDCVYDPAYIKHCYPDWYKSLYGDLSPEEAIHDPGGCVERMENDPDEKYGCYDDEDK